MNEIARDAIRSFRATQWLRDRAYDDDQAEELRQQEIEQAITVGVVIRAIREERRGNRA